MFKNYLTTAFRNLLRSKIYSLINVTGLSFGLACVMLIILYVKDELSYDRFQNNKEQIFRVVRDIMNADGSRDGSDGYTGYPQGPQFTKAIPEIKGFVRLQSGFRDSKKGNEVEGLPVLNVDSNFLTVFSFPLLSGNPAQALKNPNAIVISEDFAKKQFGTKDALGKTVHLKDGEIFKPYIVTGVAKRCPQNSSIKFDLLLPMKVSASDETAADAWMTIFLNTFVVLQPGADIKSVEAKMKNVYEKNAAEDIRVAKVKYDVKWTAKWLLQPFTSIHLSKDYPPLDGLVDASSPTFSYILSSIALFILFIACINFVNLTVSRSLKRAKEIGIRKVVGGSRRQLIIQFLGESFLLCFFAFVFALVWVELLLPVFNELSNKALSLSYLLDAKLIVGYVALFLATGFLAGFYPAMVLSGFDPVATLYGRVRFAGKNYLQRSLVVLQFSLAAFLITGTAIIFSQFNHLVKMNLGYDDQNVMVTNFPDQKRVELFKQQLLSNPAIVAASPKNYGYYNAQAVTGPETKVGVVIETVDESFIPLLKVPIVKGRNLSKEYSNDTANNVVVNETFVKQAGWTEPIGKQFKNGYDDPALYTVVGVCKDFNYQPLDRDIKAQIFSMKLGRGVGSFYIRINPANLAEGMRHIEKTFKQVLPLTPFFYTFKSDENRQYYAAEASWKRIILFASIITIFISCIGLFGLSVLAVEKRTKEIGVRKVLGASVQTIVGLLSADFLKLVAIALLIAAPAAWYAGTEWLQNYAYRITLNWQLFGFSALILLALAIFTIAFQSIKAALANPVKSLRTE